jgi:hypothetical protein
MDLRVETENKADHSIEEKMSVSSFVSHFLRVVACICQFSLFFRVKLYVSSKWSHRKPCSP